MSMYLPVGELCVELHSDSDIVNDEWKRLFGGWLQAEPISPVAMRLNVAYADQLPPRPDGDPIFVDERLINRDTGHGLHDVYMPSDDLMIHYFPDGGYLNVPLDTPDGELPVLDGLITHVLMDFESFDDYTTVAISPIMRQLGYYFVHSSGVSINDKGVLFVGESKSGKTTTCLNLVLQGWDLLSNDVVILHQKEDGIYAYPMPDLLTIRTRTFDLLPTIRTALEGKNYHELRGETMISTADLFSHRWSSPVRIEGVCFPRVYDQPDNIIGEQPKVITLARLLETSLDCWDEASLAAHTELMVTLSNQAKSVVLRLGRDLDGLPATLEAEFEL